MKITDEHKKEIAKSIRFAFYERGVPATGNGMIEKIADEVAGLTISPSRWSIIPIIEKIIDGK
ncbi:MAG: hypothetical protein PHU03_03060 [Syntrophales bacterium]|nr:hypothetical protein [Syntrophales bacterium]